MSSGMMGFVAESLQNVVDNLTSAVNGECVESLCQSYEVIVKNEVSEFVDATE